MVPFLLGGSSERTGIFWQDPSYQAPRLRSLCALFLHSSDHEQQKSNLSNQKTTSRNQQTPNKTIHTSLPSMQARLKKHKTSRTSLGVVPPRDTAGPPSPPLRPGRSNSSPSPCGEVSHLHLATGILLGLATVAAPRFTSKPARRTETSRMGGGSAPGKTC